MGNKLNIIQEPSSWENSLAEWDRRAEAFAAERPLKSLGRLPSMPGTTADTAKNLKWKSLWWMVTRDHKLSILRHFLRHPVRYTKRFIQSALRGKPYLREGDFFLYGIDRVDDFVEEISKKDSILVVGFSYCHKPFECPSGRFTDQCIHDPNHPVCGQCFIGKCMHALPSGNCVPLVIPTIHYIGNKIFEIVHAHPGKRICFLITACELTLEMFGDLGNMVDVRGIGVRLDGRICNTMKAFELSEKGVKPGLTVVLEPTKKRILELLKPLIAP